MKHLLWIVLPAVALVLGCGPGPGAKLYPVKGTVTIDGAPLPAGTVTLYPMAGDPTRQPIINGQIGADGGYEVRTDDKPGAPKGDYLVTVFANVSKDSITPPEWLAPQKYTDPTGSGLRLTVSEAPAAGAYDLKLTK